GGRTGQSRRGENLRDTLRRANEVQHRTIVAPERTPAGELVDEAGAVLQGPCIHPPARGGLSEGGNETVWVTRGEQDGGWAAGAQVEIAEQVGTPRPQAGPQRGERCRPPARTEDDQVVIGRPHLGYGES